MSVHVLIPKPSQGQPPVDLYLFLAPSQSPGHPAGMTCVLSEHGRQRVLANPEAFERRFTLLKNAPRLEHLKLLRGPKTMFIDGFDCSCLRESDELALLRLAQRFQNRALSCLYFICVIVRPEDPAEVCRAA
ncbi:MAG: hypothetical protein AB199_03270 [Parcubacteria bacterium C7867-004]|nr:MAG: hypothetical protein AB199_03270 [Parcubacteria bacterium C7867-004]